MRIGIVGCGNIARVHIPFILKNKKHIIVGLCDEEKKNADALAQRFRIANSYGDFAHLLDEQNLDVVHILTPPQTHAALSLQAMEAGCHVLVEKPMALSVQEADRMIDAAKDHGVKLCVNHNQLFDPVFLEARRLIEKGAVGTVIGVESYYGFNLAQTSERRWVDSLPGGVFQNLAPHPLSVILEFLQDPLELHATSMATGVLGPHLPDELRVLMTGKNAVGTLSISLGISPHLNFLKIYGSKAVVHVDLANMILSKERLRPLPKAVARGLMNVEQGSQLVSGAVRNAFKYVLGRLKPYQGLGNLIHAFHESIERDQDPPVPGEVGRRAVQVFESIQKKLPTVVVQQQRKNRRSEKGSRVFVTGASGFLGSHLVEKLSKDGTVIRALVRPTSRIGHLKHLDIEWVDGDLGNVEELKRTTEGCDVVYHCAAATKGTWSDYLEATIRGTERLLQASVAVGVRRFVYISSLSVYGVHQLKDNEWVTEDTPYELHPEQRGYYAHSKIEAEKVVRGYAQDQGLPTTILRPGTIYGPRGKVFFPRIGYSLKNRFFVVIGRGDHLLPLAYVENVVDAIHLAGTREDAACQIYNIVDDEMITQEDYLRELIQRTGLKAFTVHVPFGCIYMAASLLEIKAALTKRKSPPLISRYRLVCNARNVRYDTSRAKNHLQWKPTISLEEGLNRTFASHNREERIY